MWVCCARVVEEDLLTHLVAFVGDQVVLVVFIMISRRDFVVGSSFTDCLDMVAGVDEEEDVAPSVSSAHSMASVLRAKKSISGDSRSLLFRYFRRSTS